VTLHQRGIYEMHVATNTAEFNRAETYLNEALEIEPYNKTIRHSLAELDLRRSRSGRNPVERLAWRRSATSRAEALVQGSTNAYPHATLVKAAIDDVRDALASFERSETEGADIG
jgi:hypothetical protein